MKEFLRKFKYLLIVLLILLIGFCLYSLAGYLVNKNYGKYNVTDKKDTVEEAKVDDNENENEEEEPTITVEPIGLEPEDSIYNYDISDLGERSIDTIKTLFSKSPVNVLDVSKVSEDENGVLTGKILFDGNITVYFDAEGGIEPYRYYSYSNMSDELIKYIGCNERYTYTDENGTKEWNLF